MAKNNLSQDFKELYIGVMSGTSLDGIDCVLYDFDTHRLVESEFTPYPLSLIEQLKDSFDTTSYAQIAQIELLLTKLYIQTIKNVLKKSKKNASYVKAIGLHGQTVFHQPKKYSKQLAIASLVATQTGITTINDFRTNDIVMKGEGAPLAPKYHAYMLNINKLGDASVVNIGGISNITIVSQNSVTGYDIGPGNTLINHYMKKYFNKEFDNIGETAKSGTLIPELLKSLLNDAYFHANIPKSTGVEYFNNSWVEVFLTSDYQPQDIIHTLTELTAQTISNNLHTKQVYICGGGAHNRYLIERICELSPHCEVNTTDKIGIPVDYVEAIAFAYFAKLHIEAKSANIKDVTGAFKEVILGTKYLAL